MVNPKDLDLFARSLNGDWHSRIEIFRKYVWDNAQLRRAGSSYRNVEDFLHDTFANALRSGHSFDFNNDLGSWFHSVGVWTDLERRRFRSSDARQEPGSVRLSAATEADEQDSRARLTAYAPPSTGTSDTLHSRLTSIIGEPQFSILVKLANGSTWDQAAADAGRPLNGVGFIAARALDRLARFFGAPPPLNDDLEPVFSATRREQSEQKYSGRLAALHLDRTFYAITPAMRKLGCAMPGDVRSILLWDAACSSTPPSGPLREHLNECSYCTDVLRAMLLAQQALVMAPASGFRICPGAFTLLNTATDSYPPLNQHLAECSACREESTDLLDAGVNESVRPEKAGTNRAMLLAAGAFGIVLIGGGVWWANSHSAAKSRASDIAAVAEPVATYAVNAKYSGLAQPIDVTDKKLLASVQPQNVDVFNQLKMLLQNGRVGVALMSASPLGERDPGIEMLYSVGLFQQKAISEGYRAMLKSEAMSPRHPFRCWATMQWALVVGDIKTVERETEHLANDAEYGKPAKALLERARSLG
jgi:DNA-directed RNA polymerase specialized sigma24 family protein